MGVEILHSKQTGSASAEALTITAATAGSTLVAMLGKSASITAPKIKDNISGEAGWVISSTKAVGTTSANSLWYARKTAVGGETTLTMAPEGGVGQGISYWELAKAGEDEQVLHTDNAANGKTIKSPTFSTANAGAVVLAAVSDGASGFSSFNWTTLVNTEATTTRCMGGAYIPGTTLTGFSTEATWETSRQAQMLLVVINGTAGNTSRTTSDVVLSWPQSSMRGPFVPARTTVDAITGSDLANRATGNMARSTSDTGPFSDAATRSGSGGSRATSDTITGSDSAMVSARALHPSTHDTFAFSDSVLSTAIVSLGEPLVVVVSTPESVYARVDRPDEAPLPVHSSLGSLFPHEGLYPHEELYPF